MKMICWKWPNMKIGMRVNLKKHIMFFLVFKMNTNNKLLVFFVIIILLILIITCFCVWRFNQDVDELEKLEPSNDSGKTSNNFVWWIVAIIIIVIVIMLGVWIYKSGEKDNNTTARGRYNPDTKMGFPLITPDATVNYDDDPSFFKERVLENLPKNSQSGSHNLVSLEVIRGRAQKPDERMNSGTFTMRPFLDKQYRSDLSYKGYNK